MEHNLLNPLYGTVGESNYIISEGYSSYSEVKASLMEEKGSESDDHYNTLQH